MSVMFVHANSQHGAYRNPEDDTGYWEHDCSYVVPDCRRWSVNFVFDPTSNFWYWYFSSYGNPWRCGGYCCGLFVIHDFGICLAAGQKAKSADKDQRISYTKVDDCPYIRLAYHLSL